MLFYRRWMWHYPAKIASVPLLLSGCMSFVYSLELTLAYGQSSNYILAAGSVLVGAGCAMLVYHVQKRGEEDTAAKKKIALVGMTVSMLMVALEMLSILNIL